MVILNVIGLYYILSPPKKISYLYKNDYHNGISIGKILGKTIGIILN